MIADEYREDLRRQAIAVLANNQDTPYSVSVLTARLRERLPEVRFDERDVDQALAFLDGLYLVKRVETALGASVKWQATSQGVLFHERNS